MRRMEPRSHMLANLQLIGGTVASAAPFLGGIILATAAVRYDAEPSVLAALNDMGVLFIELSTMPALFQGAALAAAIGADRSPDPILPRWYGYLSLTWSILAQGGVFAMFFETGPLSQNGIIGIAVPIIALFVWFVATAFVLIRIRPEQWHAADRT
ncbi:hypothetical protein DIE21_15390 [Burkholderia sp. Bp9140]|nr:hypothetical protein DIE21_15390 [Burkholderia sp. Bp9140]